MREWRANRGASRRVAAAALTSRALPLRERLRARPNVRLTPDEAALVLELIAYVETQPKRGAAT